MRVRVDDYLGRPGPVIIANPNAPTGIALPRAEIARLAGGRAESPIVVDEAYVDFGGETAIPLVRDHPNLLVVQTMSKSRALAGLRVGYAIGDAGLIEALTRVKDGFNSYPLGRLAQAGAVASIEDEDHFQQTRVTVMRNRGLLTSALQERPRLLPRGQRRLHRLHPRGELGAEVRPVQPRGDDGAGAGRACTALPGSRDDGVGGELPPQLRRARAPLRPRRLRDPQGRGARRRRRTGIIPGSMGAKSFIVRGKGEAQSFCTCSHGLGGP